MDIAAFNALVRPSSPNTYLMTPEGVCANAVPDRVSGVFAGSISEVYAALEAIISAESNWELAESDAAQGMVTFVSTSKLMRYKDDVDVLIVPAEAGQEGCRLAIYSRSRVGYSDMGANRKRVIGLVERLKDVQKQI